MKLVPTSLAGRLLVGMALFTLLALTVTLVVMDRIFERFVTGQIDQRLDNKLVSLASEVRVAGDGMISIEGDANGPPFDEPRHMSFWRVEGPRNAIESRWLQPGSFTPPTRAEVEAIRSPPPPPALRGETRTIPHPRTLHLLGPGQVSMHVRVVIKDFGTTPVTILAAAPTKAITDPMREALTTLALSLVVLCLVLVAASVTLVRVTLAPLMRLRGEVADVRVGSRTTLPEAQPNEIKPLVEELNFLLAQNATNLVRARTHVANLAHGLKTPLATLSLGLVRLDRESRESLQPLVETIERRVRHHLGRARSAAKDGPVRQQTEVGPHLFDIVEALQKVYAEKRVAVISTCPPALFAACDPQDVDEILGNLIDNAFKYATCNVSCHVAAEGMKIAIEIEDDGPGLKMEDIDHVLQPGHRLDERIPGFGFGLPIARELIELYAGDLALMPQDRGLRVRLTLPKAPQISR